MNSFEDKAVGELEFALEFGGSAAACGVPAETSYSGPDFLMFFYHPQNEFFTEA